MKKNNFIPVIIALLLIILYVLFLSNYNSQHFNQSKEDKTKALPAETISAEQKKAKETNLSESSTEELIPAEEINPEFKGKQGMAPKIYKNKDAAVAAVREFLKTGSNEIIDEFTAMQGDCEWCGQFYDELKNILKDPRIAYGEKFRLGFFLSINGSSEALKILLDTAEFDPEFNQAHYLFESIASMPQRDEVVQVYGARLLSSDVSEFRKALTAGLGFGKSLTAAQYLYEDLVKNNSDAAFAKLGAGLPSLQASQEAANFLKEKAETQSFIQPLILASLLQSGGENTNYAVNLILGYPKEKREKLILDIKSCLRWRNPAALNQLKEKINSEKLDDFSLLTSF